MENISVIIPNLNGQPHLEKQIYALAKQKTIAQWEVIISDNGSSQPVYSFVEAAKKNFPVNLKIVDSSNYPGASGARNFGALHASGSILAFCDSDDYVLDTWVQAISDGIQDSDVCGGPLYEYHTDSENMLRPLGRSSLYKNSRQKYTFLSCNLAIKKETFFKVGGFDWGLPSYGSEDTELAIRLNNYGVTFKYQPEMGVKFRETSGFLNKTKKIYLANIAEIEVWKRHPDLFVRQNSPGWPMLIMTDVFRAVYAFTKTKNYSKIYRQLIKLPAIMKYNISPKSSALYLSDMMTDATGRES